ncbi:hypothetical protein ES708_05195 [subsurface metagenome]
MREIAYKSSRKYIIPEKKKHSTGSVLCSYKRREKMFKAFNSKKLTNNKHIILGSREKQNLLFSLVHLILC